MEIKIGFSQNQRELAIDLGELSEESTGATLTSISNGLKSGDEFLSLGDVKGQKYFINPREVAYVQVSTEKPARVGFGGV